MTERILAILSALAAILLAAPANAAQPEGVVETTWRLLDYIAVDYREAVTNGRVTNDAEYAEMSEFSSTVETHLRTLDPSPGKTGLLREAQGLRQAIAKKSDPNRVANLARELGADLLKAYPVQLAPQSPPEVQRGATLYQTQCASCHGVAGDGRGPDALKLDPPPIDFSDRSRASQRSVFALQQVISQGLEGTAMQSFSHLPEQDRWALAFQVGTFAYPKQLATEGQRIWESDVFVRQQIPDLKALVGITPQTLANAIGQQKAAAVIAYLRSNPSALKRSAGGSLALTRTRLAESVAAYRLGDPERAKRLALSAYLDGFEPVEPVLSARDPSLMRKIETAMGEFRSRIAQAAPVANVQEQAELLDGLFAQAEEALSESEAGGVSTFFSALTILLREGVEALLLVVAMIAFLRKSEREDALPYVHGGWIAALVAGLLTWMAATAFLSISGASRELTEGFGGILAALILVSVGIWMHGKSQADTWQRYVRERMSRAMDKGSAWFLFGLAFLVVYREVFETILFYAAMWTEGSKGAVIGGAAVGAAALAAIAWAMMRYSLRLPIAQFFRYSSILIAVLAVILAGKGMAAIQEAGLLGVTPIGWLPQIDLMGLHPSVQVVGAQLLVLAAVLVGFWLNGRRDPARAAT